MAIDDHPITVFNRQLENDELAQPVGSGAIKGAAKVVGAICQIPALRPLGFIAKGLEITGKCLSIGVPAVEENLKLFGKLTEEAILRHEEGLVTLAASAEEAQQFQRRLESKEFLQYLTSGVLQTQRTTQENRLKRMAWIIANSVKEGDLDPESGDDMMRAAAELRGPDISLLKELYECQSPMDMNETDRGRTDLADRMGSVAKLQAVAFVQLRTPGSDLGANIVVLLPNGKKFYERLQEIAVQE